MRRNAPSKAFILAAGFGTRMLPLSRDLPKPMMPLWGRPILEHVLLLLRNWGVRDVLINAHHRPGELVRWAAGRPVAGLRVNFSFEPEILGTGGALRRAAWFLDKRPFWLINADVAADLDPAPLLRAFARARPLAALWLHPSLGPRTVSMENGLVTSFHAPVPGSEGTFTFCGLHLLSPRILDYLPAEGFAGIVPAYERATKRGERIAGVCVPDSFWADLGTPRQYLDAHAAVRQARLDGKPGGRLFARMPRPAGARVQGWAAIPCSVRIAAGCRIENAVAWEGARLGPRTRITDAIVGRDAVVNEPVRFLAGRGDRVLDDAEQKALQQYGWPAAQATVLPFGPRGSARAFARIRRGSQSLILVRYDSARAENALQVPHTRFLARFGFPVPAVRLDQPAARLALLEDAGDRCLRDVVLCSRPNRIELLYERILDQAARLHETGTRRAQQEHLPLMQPFTPKLYRWERELFVTHFLRNAGRASAGEIRRIRRELAGIAARLNRAPRVLLHRDLQSSNILLKRGLPVFIDFQGMRFGPAAYDLASLLCDPYVALPEPLQEKLLRHYARRRPSDPSAIRLFRPAAVERLAQALGAYGQLSAQPGLESFARFIPPALRLLRRALGRSPALPVLAAVTERLLSRESSGRR
ncbi:MAG TPA: sugar phosphate nucleotidyltransferase [Kiritimatiellia bacterium]|nr:sugar phosphate nucleotidyltransferase [Kiritimatiellia bacterium]HRZ13184.1 sugar phosphate nucleotidyltransferase [Kiritimatiellia bacterium]HSA17605.1 sugar phosphate nucleotidyltransferase [Kiritimatiellia bacterium]